RQIAATGSGSPSEPFGQPRTFFTTSCAACRDLDLNLLLAQQLLELANPPTHRSADRDARAPVGLCSATCLLVGFDAPTSIVSRVSRLECGSLSLGNDLLMRLREIVLELRASAKHAEISTRTADGVRDVLSQGRDADPEVEVRGAPRSRNNLQVEP